MVTTFMESEQKKLLKKFHTLLGKAGIGQVGKEAILQSYQVESSRDLTAKELLDICNKLSMQTDSKMAEVDRWRKRVIAAIFGFCNAIGKDVDMNYVKGIACRSAGFDDINKIPVARLINIYYEFTNKAKDAKKVSSIASDEMLNNINWN